MFLGIHQFEKDAQQRVLISATIKVDGVDGSESDMFDYDAVVAFIRTFGGTRIDTQEELIQKIHANILLNSSVTWARVSSRKPDVYPDVESIGVSFEGSAA